ncbi:MAG: hypothetical protein HQ538_04830 [Parcubacteria group bacterium]|nr:hypothetical protein [Parcubacteria group bacterium]
MKNKLKYFSGLVLILALMLVLTGCTKTENDKKTNTKNSTESSLNDDDSSTSSETALTGDVNVIYLHHSTGENIWNGGVPEYIEEYNSDNNTDYQIEELAFPSDEYGWENYPYDYWNIWVNNAGSKNYQGQPTLETLTDDYDVISWKHCFPVGEISEDPGYSSVDDSTKTAANYKLQYNALKDKMHEFSDNKFIVWTGAALIQDETESANAQRTQEFFEWVKNSWDESGDNIYVWDFYELETEGGLYMKDSYADGDSHPNSSFSSKVAPYFGKRLVDVIEGDGDSGSITGK